VLTHDVPDGSDDLSVTFLGGEITNAVNRALTAARGKNVLVLGANVAKQCIDAGLLDEVLLGRLVCLSPGLGLAVVGVDSERCSR
jgi:dihydrofolate reductase